MFIKTLEQDGVTIFRRHGADNTTTAKRFIAEIAPLEAIGRVGAWDGDEVHVGGLRYVFGAGEWSLAS